MRIWIVLFCMVSSIWAVPVDLEENETFELEKKSVAVIIKVEGKAKILSQESINKHEAKLGEALYEGDRLLTYAATNVLVELDDSSSVILAANSELSFIDTNNLKQDTGEIYYKVKARKSTQGLKVQTPFSIMGIKGTEFIVEANAEETISLNEGIVDIESLKANFELHKKQVMKEYKKFKDEQNTAFEAYKDEIKGESVSYVKEFELEAGKVLHFSSAQNCQATCESQVNEKDISAEVKKKFELYQKMLEQD